MRIRLINNDHINGTSGKSVLVIETDDFSSGCLGTRENGQEEFTSVCPDCEWYRVCILMKKSSRDEGQKRTEPPKTRMDIIVEEVD